MQYKGQVTLLLVLGIMVVGLSVGLARLSQTRTSTKETGYSVQSEQSFACAEAGLEKAVSCVQTLVDNLDPAYPAIDDVKSTCEISDEASPPAEQLESCDYELNIEPLSQTLEFRNIDKDTAEAIVLNESEDIRLDIEWSLPSGSPREIMELNFLIPNGTGYDIGTRLLICNSGVPNYPTSQNNLSFSEDVDDNGVCNFTNISSLNSLIVQMVARIDDISSVKVTANGSIPAQGYNITSTGTSGETERILSVNHYTNKLAARAKLITSSLFTSSIENGSK
jgi:hypothetical protein